MPLPAVAPGDLEKASTIYEANEERESMYRVASFLLTHWWGKYDQLADSLSVLLFTWNEAFYRYGMFENAKLRKCLAENWQSVESFRPRDISSFSEKDYIDVAR